MSRRFQDLSFSFSFLWSPVRGGDTLSLVTRILAEHYTRHTSLTVTHLNIPSLHIPDPTPSLPIHLHTCTPVQIHRSDITGSKRAAPSRAAQSPPEKKRYIDNDSKQGEEDKNIFSIQSRPPTLFVRPIRQRRCGRRRMPQSISISPREPVHPLQTKNR